MCVSMVCCFCGCSLLLMCVRPKLDGTKSKTRYSSGLNLSIAEIKELILHYDCNGHISHCVYSGCFSMLSVPNQSPVRWVRWEMFAEPFGEWWQKSRATESVLYCDYSSTWTASSLTPTWGYDQVTTRMTEFSLVQHSDGSHRLLVLDDCALL